MTPFKAYDIRGVYGTDIDELLAFRVGRAFAALIQQRRSAGSAAPRVLGGYDARTHSPDLYAAFTAGAQQAGAKITGAGCTSTPALHYLQMQHGYDAGFMATASHNPPQYHGFKLYDGSGGSISYEKGLQQLETAARADRTALPDDRPPPPLLAAEQQAAYVEFAARHVTPAARGMQVVVDAANGSAGAVTAEVAARMGLQAQVLNATPDGTFPAHVPNPLERESQQQVAAEVPRVGAALGAVLDGDGDRILFCDEKGRIVESYFAGALIATRLLEEDPGAAVVYDLISSRTFPEAIAAAGGKPVKSRVGYTFLYDEMVANQAIYGNETSGHVYFRVTDSFYTESALYALGVLVNLLAASGKLLSELVAPLRGRYFQQDEVNIPLEGTDPQAALAAIRKAFADGEQDELDGVSVSYDRYWFNLRPSNTEPLLRLRLEAVDETAAQEATTRILELVSAS